MAEMTQKQLAARYGITYNGLATARSRRRAGRDSPKGKQRGREKVFDVAEMDAWWYGTNEQHGTPTAYRGGCRCVECMDAHAEDVKAYRHQRQYGPDGPMRPEVLDRILREIRRGRSVEEVAANQDVTRQAVTAAAKAVPAFGQSLRDALSTRR